MGTRARWRRLILGTVTLLGLFGIVPVAAQDTTPAVGDLVVDSFDCDTGLLSFHVPVTDLPRTPSDVNEALGYSATGNYEQGSAGLPARGYNPAAEQAPYAGDVDLSLNVPLTGAEAPQDASGRLQSIVISVSVGTSDGTGPTDTSRTTYQVACDGSADADTGAEWDDPDTDVPDGSVVNETTELPATGTGPVGASASDTGLATLMGGVALLLGAAALRVRRQA
jgi:hypothetical protein